MSDYQNTNGLGNASTFYDKMPFNPLHYKKKRGGKHEVGVDLEKIIPDADEIRLLGNRHKNCQYYQIGVELCHTKMLKEGSDNFLACKVPIDGMWRCYTEEKYGHSIRDAPEYTKQHEEKFYDCMFREASGLDMCMNHFSDMVRQIHRSGESTLNTNF